VLTVVRSLTILSADGQLEYISDLDDAVISVFATIITIGILAALNVLA
jgi:hypothetical protein